MQELHSLARDLMLLAVASHCAKTGSAVTVYIDERFPTLLAAYRNEP